MGDGNWVAAQTHKTCEKCRRLLPVAAFARTPSADVLYARRCRECDYPAALKRAKEKYAPKTMEQAMREEEKRKGHG